MNDPRSHTPADTPERFVRFKLTATLTAGGSATAHVIVVRRDGTETESTREITVHDWTNSRDGVADDLGYARWMDDAARYEIIDKVC